MKTICFTGPESTGKSTLSQLTAKHYDATLVKEYAREYIDQLARPYVQDDLLVMAQEQFNRQLLAQESDQGVVIFDTDLLTYKIWSEYKYGHSDPWILDHLHKQHIDLYILCDIDIPWRYDEQRENPTDREELMDIYKRELDSLGVKTVIVSGSIKERMKQIYDEVSS